MDNLSKNREELMRQIGEIAGERQPAIGHGGYIKLIVPTALAGLVLIVGLMAAAVFSSKPKIQPTMFATTIEGQNHQVEVTNTHNKFN